MRITKNQLRRSIKEEIAAVLREDGTAKAPELDVDYDPSKGGIGSAGPRKGTSKAQELPAGSETEQKGKSGRGEEGTKADQPSKEEMEADAAEKAKKKKEIGARMEKAYGIKRESRLHITKNQLRQIIKEELSFVLKEDWRERLSNLDLKRGGGVKGKMQRMLGDYHPEGDYDPYTMGELGSDIGKGVSKAFGSLPGRLFGTDEARSAEEVQTDIDATNAALKSGELSQLDAGAALAKLGREKSDITGVPIGQEAGAFEGLPVMREGRRNRRRSKK